MENTTIGRSDNIERSILYIRLETLSETFCISFILDFFVEWYLSLSRSKVFAMSFSANGSFLFYESIDGTFYNRTPILRSTYTFSIFFYFTLFRPTKTTVGDFKVRNECSG